MIVHLCIIIVELVVRASKLRLQAWKLPVSSSVDVRREGDQGDCRLGNCVNTRSDKMETK